MLRDQKYSAVFLDTTSPKAIIINTAVASPLRNA